uniref:Alanine--glyoxylate aminotransferase 2, mitochondrial n=1 Tax=Suricata suricatta TaxID=37032 RepID=A0A673SY38_SURSU
MLLKFAELRDEFEIVGDVRGKGLMIGIEMVKDKMSRQPLPQEEVNQIHEDCKRMGLIIGRGGIFAQTFRIAPSMCITKPDVQFAVEVFRSALIQHMERRAFVCLFVCFPPTGVFIHEDFPELSIFPGSGPSTPQCSLPQRVWNNPN